MTNAFSLRPFRAPAASLIIGQLLLGYIGPATAQAIPKQSSSPEADSEVFSPLEEPDPTFRQRPTLPVEEPDAVPSRARVQPPQYLIGPGDALRFDVFNVPELTNDESGNRLVADSVYRVLVDGTVSLPWIGSVYVEGLTLEGAAAAVAREYEEFIFDPVVSFSVFERRPTRIAVVGEVERPGAYTTREEGADSTEVSVAELRTVAQAIQNAGGITQLADIRNIELVRPQPDGTRDVIPVDFYALLIEGDQSQNRLLRDGDTIVVPTATVLTPADARALASASFAPDSIGVDVVGEIDAPGRIEIEPNSTLNQAILAAGGFTDPRAQTAEVTLIRVNPDGTVNNRNIAVDLAAGVNTENNPALQENDIVIVSRSGLTQTADFLDLLGTAAGAVITPILGITGILDFFNGDEGD